jgi:hypothetical protein
MSPVAVVTSIGIGGWLAMGLGEGEDVGVGVDVGDGVGEALGVALGGCVGEGVLTVGADLTVEVVEGVFEDMALLTPPTRSSAAMTARTMLDLRCRRPQTTNGQKAFILLAY